MKLAITGTGQIVQTVLPYLKTWGWEPAALCATGRSAGKAQELAMAHDCPAVYTDFAVMLSEVKEDVVYLGVSPITFTPAWQNKLFWLDGM